MCVFFTKVRTARSWVNQFRTDSPPRLAELADGRTCPSKFYFQKSASCIQNEPGGQCKGKEVGRSGWERVMVILTAVAESCGTSPRSPAIFETCDMMFQ